LCPANIVLLAEYDTQFIPLGYETYKWLIMSQTDNVCGALTPLTAAHF